MRFLVFGASGMAGHVICIYLMERGHHVTGFSRRKVPFTEAVAGNVRNIQQVEEMIVNGNFDAVINAVGVLNQFAEEDKEAAVYLNGYFPHLLAKITSQKETQVIHISTDCVFSGKTGLYTENSFRDGESFYDRSKAIGELEDEKNLTLRNSIVGPDINKDGIGLLNWFMKQRGQVNGYTKVMWTGMTTLQLAKTIEVAANNRIHGLINMVNGENISKYELLKLFNRYIRNEELIIKPFDGFVMDKTLLRTNYEFDYEVPGYEEMVSEMAEWMRNHRELYPHYQL